MWDAISSTGPLYAVLLAGGIAVLSVLNNKRKAIKAPKGASRERQAIPVEGQPGVYKCGYLPDPNLDVVETAYPEVTTLYDVFLRGIDKSENGHCLGHRAGDSDYNWMSYAQVFRKSRDVGAALVGLCGLKPGQNTHVGIYAKNCPEWFLTTLACVQQSMVVVPLYETLGAEAANYIVQQTEIEVIIVDTVDKAEKLLKGREEMPSLRHVIVIETSDKVQLPQVDEISVHGYEEVINYGEFHPVKMHLPNKEDTYIICYTSGTTGVPKGVVLSHKNLIANLTSFEIMVAKFLPDALTKNDSIISYLPLSHMFEQMCHWVMVMNGGSIGYFRGNVTGLTSDMQVLKPTLFPVVPRLLNRFVDQIEANLKKAGPIARRLYNFAYQRKLSMLNNGVVANDTLWDKIVFKKIQNLLGGKVRIMATGSAPISAQVLETSRITLGATIVEAYGQTECTALATCTWPGEMQGGHTGGPGTCTLLKLDDVPELNYFSKDSKGEILIKGPSVTSGYFKDPEKTAELIDKDGFLHTGDIGHLQPNGTLRVIDRKKHIFKLAQGEYVAPEKIENVYARCGVVQQVYVDGDSLERYLIAVIVPESKVLIDWAQKTYGERGTIEQICKDPKAEKFVLDELTQIGKENKLNSIEQVKQVILESDPFTVENGLLTPTLKAKRPQLRLKYKEQMAVVYKEHPL